MPTPLASGSAVAQASGCSTSTPKAYFTTNPFNWNEEMSLIVEQEGACNPTYFYFYQSNDGGQSYQNFYGGTANQLAMSYGNFAAGTNFYYAVYACDSSCSLPGYITVTDNGPSTSTAFNYVSGQQWFYQNAGFVNNGGGYTGQNISSNPSGADRYLAILQTPQPGTNLTSLGEAFTYINAYTNNGWFYQVGYAQNANGFEWFAATTYQGQGASIVGYDQNGNPIYQWNGIGCAQGTNRHDWYPATTGGITVRCDLPGTAPNTQQTYDIHSYTNMVYTGVNNSYILDATDSNLGYMYRAAAVQEAVGGAQSPQATFAQTSPTKATGNMVESWFQYNGVNFSTIVSDYYVNSDVFDAARNTTSPECGLPNIASIQRETPTYPWGMRWDAGLPDC